MKNVEQYFDDFEVFNDEQIKEVEGLIGQKLMKVFAKHDRSDYSRFKLYFENGKCLTITAMNGDANSYFDVGVSDK